MIALLFSAAPETWIPTPAGLCRAVALIGLGYLLFKFISLAAQAYILKLQVRLLREECIELSRLIRQTSEDNGALSLEQRELLTDCADLKRSLKEIEKEGDRVHGENDEADDFPPGGQAR